jgi:ABC-type branched-subunit amino acid transport system substrate-binding protein
MILGVQNPSESRFRPDASCVRAVLFACLAGLISAGCVPVGTPEPPPPAPKAPEVPSIERGTLPPSAASEGVRLLRAAEDSLDLGEMEGARRSARRVIQYYPSAPGSAEALRVLARASTELDFNEEAEEAAEAYEGLLSSSHPRYPQALLLSAQTFTASGKGEAALEKLLLLPRGSPPAVTEPANDLLRPLLEPISSEELRDLAEAAPSDHPLLAVIAAAHAVSLNLRGEQEQAEEWARRVLASSPAPRELELAQAVLDDDMGAVLGRPVILGAILPLTDASPGLLQYSEWINEGIQVAVEVARGNIRTPIQLEIADDEGRPLGGSRSIQDLEAVGALGVVGPLTRPALYEAASARTGDLPVISPAAFLPPEEASGVYSLSGPNPGGARMVARYARDLELERVVVLRPRTEESRVDAEAFLDAFEEAGGVVPREVVYDSGATFFQAEFEQVGGLLPDGLFLPLTPRDIQLLVPQFTYYGLDTLGIQLLGTSGWTAEEVVQEVDSRHTDGVIASTTRMSQDETEAFRRFREAYEELFQRSLRSEVPALGHDAAALLLEASKGGARTPGGLLSELEKIRDFPGATGRLTIEGGRINREPYLVRIQDHELIYISSRFE